MVSIINLALKKKKTLNGEKPDVLMSTYSLCRKSEPDQECDNDN